MTHGAQSPLHRNDLLLDAAPQAISLPRLLQSQRLRLFYGDLHNHTGYSDGHGRPEDALRQMRERGLHFAAITDHGEFFDRESAVRDPNKWAAAAAQVAALTSDDFLAIRGFEWSSPSQGHSNVWWSAGYTGYLRTGDESMDVYYRWLEQAEPTPGAAVLAGFNHPGREVACFDGCSYAPALEDRIVTLECFNRDDDYGPTYFRALDRGWHVGAIGVSDHHGTDWGSPHLPRAGLLAPALTLQGMQDALQNRRVFATRSPSLRLVMAGNGALMGSRLTPRPDEPLDLGIWCDDPEANGDWTRIELWTNGGTLVEAHETRGVEQLNWRTEAHPEAGMEQWYVMRILHAGAPVAYTSPIWVSSKTVGRRAAT
jgi:hypothetical protein